MVLENKVLVWEEVLKNIQVKVNEIQYIRFISPILLRDISTNPNIVHLEYENSMVVNIVNRRYLHLIEETFQEVTGEKYNVILKTSMDYRDTNLNNSMGTSVSTFSPAFLNTTVYTTFDPNMSFDNFVIGDCNKFAAAICKALAERPFDLYNPLFIYGNSGLGKSHLLNAIGIYILEHNKDMRVLSVTAEEFTNDYIRSVENHTPYEFKDKYRRPDVLLIDDIQFLEKKLKTQDEFFYTFETLLKDKKQIVVSGDRPPTELSTVDERLKSRFMMNTTVSVYNPDYETRIAILNKRANLMNVEITDEIKEIIEFISDKFPDNIRALTGSFKTVIDIARETHQDPTIALAKILLKDLVIKEGGSITPQKIKSSVAKYYNIKISDLDSESRKADYALPRQIAMYLCRTMTDYSLPRIGEVFGNKHYSTVKHACDKIEREVSVDNKLKENIDEIKKNISLL